MSDYLDDLVNVSITSQTRTVSRQGFGTPLIAAYHTRWADRVRSYTSLSAMRTDGFKTSDPVYKIAAAVFAQSPAPKRVRIGRRASAFTQVVDLTPTTPGNLEVFTVEVSGLAATFTADASATLAEACTGVAAAINGLADVDAILATGGASSASEQTLSGTQLNGVTGYRAMSPARRVTLVLSSHADWDASTAVITGTDVDGAALTANLTIPNGGNTTLTTTAAFRTVTSIYLPAQSGTGGTFTAGVAAPVTADGTSGTKVVCTSPAGELHSYKVTTSNAGVLNLAIKDATADPGLAADLDAILAANADWYGLLLDSQGYAEVATASTGAAAWTEANKRLLVVQTADGLVLSAASITDLGYVLKAAGYARTSFIYTPGLYTEWHAAAWMGERLPAEPGSDTWAFKQLRGVSSYELTDTQRDALEGKNGNHYLTAGGNAITYPGKSASGEWLDVTRFIDWLKARMRERIFGVQLNGPKIPFTNAGIGRIVTEVRAQLEDGRTVGGIDPDVPFTVTAPLASEVSSADRAARVLSGVEFNAKLAGAIHQLEISGNVSA